MSSEKHCRLPMVDLRFKSGKIRNHKSEIESQRGFTLLEVLIAMAIMVGMVTVLYSSFSSAGRNVEQAEARRDVTDLARTLVARLSDDITNAYSNAFMPETIFYGKKSDRGEDSFRSDSVFLTTLTNWRKPDSKETDLWEIGYRIEEQPDRSGRVMLRREKRLLGKESPPLEGGTDFEITGRVAGLRLRYFNGSTWSDEWDSRTRRMLPRAVEITVLLDDGSSYITQVEVGR